MNIDEAFPGKYLKAADIGNRMVRVQIDKVQTEEIGQSRDRKMVMYFIGKEKGMVLNKTNAMAIRSAYGPETGGWGGAEIELYSAMVPFQGRDVEALRVRIPPRVPNAAPPPRPQRSDFPPDVAARAAAEQKPRSGLDDDIPF